MAMFVDNFRIYTGPPPKPVTQKSCKTHPFSNYQFTVATSSNGLHNDAKSTSKRGNAPKCLTTRFGECNLPLQVEDDLKSQDCNKNPISPPDKTVIRDVVEDMSRYALALPNLDQSAKPGGPSDLSAKSFDAEDVSSVRQEPSGSLGLGSYRIPASIPVQDFSHSGPEQHQVTQRKVPAPCDSPMSECAEDRRPEHNPSTSSVLLQPRRSTEILQSLMVDGNDDNDIGSERRRDKRTREVEAGSESESEDLGINTRHLGGSDLFNSKDTDAGDEQSAKRWKSHLNSTPMKSIASSHKNSTKSHIRGPGSVAITQSNTDNAAVDDQRTQDSSVTPSALADSTQPWPFECITGKEVIDGKDYFWVRWEESLLPRSWLLDAKELIDEFEARCRTQLKVKGAPRRSNSAQNKRAATGIDITLRKRQRGRPRKQM